jgi:hypothetical protein
MFSDKLYEKFKNDTVKDLAKFKIFNDFHIFNEIDLYKTKFYSKNKHILDQKKGFGYCLWKPYYILEILNLIPENETLIYMDSADIIFNPPLFIDCVTDAINSQDAMFIGGGFKQSQYTKYDCFYKMNCLDEKYRNQIQLEAGVVAFKNTSKNKEFVNKWLEFCKDENIVTDMPNVYGNNFPEFIDHRYDQSVLTNLFVDFDCKEFEMGSPIRNTFACNHFKI